VKLTLKKGYTKSCEQCYSAEDIGGGKYRCINTGYIVIAHYQRTGHYLACVRKKKTNV